jgi:spermidine/putrescine-binding protein
MSKTLIFVKMILLVGPPPFPEGLGGRGGPSGRPRTDLVEGAASSGEVNFVGWAGYPALAEKVFPAFEAATGIKVNFKELPDQDTMYAEGKVALEAGGIDVIEPTIDRVGAWDANGLLQRLGRIQAGDGQLSAGPGRWRGGRDARAPAAC